jgi:hypothetical protein
MSIWPLVEAHISKNWEIYTAFAGACAIAAVCTMPEIFPTTWQDWWTWGRNTLQTAVPAARARQEAHSQSSTVTANATTTQEATASTALDPPQNPSKPATPAQPKIQ